MVDPQHTDTRAAGPERPFVNVSSRGNHMKRKLAAWGSAAVLFAGLGAAAPAAVAAPASGSVTAQEPQLAALAYCTTWVKITKTSTTYIRLPGAGSSISCTMGEGATGLHVAALQNALKICYGRSITVDQEFGPATESALKYAQGQAGAGVDGIYGSESRDKLKWPRFDNNGVHTGYCATR